MRVPALLPLLALALAAFKPVEPPYLEAAVGAGTLPPVAERLPAVPSVEPLDRPWQSAGRYGGDLHLLMARARDTRVVYVYSYARLVAYTPDFEIVPDILERVEVEDGRVFTLHLRRGHRWSDGHPFTSEDFRYWWEDMANNPKRYPVGPPAELAVDGAFPMVEILDAATVRYSWPRPNPFFLPLLAGAKPIEIYAPAHYLKRYHPRYTDPATLARRVEEARQKSWQQLHNRKDDLTEFNNPALPTLQPWIPVTQPPSERFVFVRNPYYHRVDPEGRQLPYIDRVVMGVADAKLIPAKVGAGEADLQARYLRFDNYTFLKQAAPRNGLEVRLWTTGVGSQVALFPNLNTTDPEWRALNRDPRYRHALSLAVNRDEINQVIYYGLAQPSNNTVLPTSPLWLERYRDEWAGFDVRRANALLDDIGLLRHDRKGLRHLPDGRPMELVVETAGESTEETDVLQLITDSWRRIGVAVYTRPSQLEVLRNRIFAGQTVMAVGRGLDNAVPTAAMSPAELVPRSQINYQWPRWGQHHETGGKDGEPVDLPAAKALLDAFEAWKTAGPRAEQADAWARILDNHADNTWTIGTVAGVPQPVVVRATLRNVPGQGLYAYDPGAHFGLYRPDCFWFADPE